MFLVTSIEFSPLENLEWRRKVFRIDISPAKSAPGQNKFSRDEKPKSWSLRPIKWITVEEQMIIHEWHLIYSNLIAQNLNVCSFSVCIVLCDESIVLLKNNFWGPAVNLVYCYGHIIYCSPLTLTNKLSKKPYGDDCHCVIFVYCTGRQRVLLTLGINSNLFSIALYHR